MTARSYLEYIVREIHTTIVATVDDEGLPVTTAIDVMATNEHGLYSLTTKGKGFYDRLVKRQCPTLTALKGENTMSCVTIFVHDKICGFRDEKMPGLSELNPCIKKICPAEESMQVLTVFQTYKDDDKCFGLSKKPIKRTSFASGGAEKRAEGYLITDACIGHGSCAVVCPQSCILTERIPYVIERGHCLHYENYLTTYPIGAVKGGTRTVPGTVALY